MFFSFVFFFFVFFRAVSIQNLWKLIKILCFILESWWKGNTVTVIEKQISDFYCYFAYFISYLFVEILKSDVIITTLNEWMWLIKYIFTGYDTRMLCAVPNKSWKRNPIKQQFYSQLPQHHTSKMTKMLVICRIHTHGPTSVGWSTKTCSISSVETLDAV